MAKSDQETSDQKTPSSSEGKSKGMLLAAALLLAMVVGSASAAVALASVALRPPSPAEAPESETTDTAETAAVPEEAQEFSFEEPIIVNVRETDQRRYLSAKPVFVVPSKDALEELVDKQGELQNMLIGVLKSKTLPQLDDPQITGSLGREIQDIANAKLGMSAMITRVYFTQLVVQ